MPRKKKTDDDLLETGNVADKYRDLPKTESPIDLFDDLDPVDRKIVNLVLQNPSINNQEISKATGKAVRTIYNRLNSEKVQRCLTGLQKTDLQLFLECRREAIIINRELMKNGKDEATKQRAAKEFLKGIVPDRVQIEDTTEYDLNEEEEHNIEKQLGIVQLVRGEKP